MRRKEEKAILCRSIDHRPNDQILIGRDCFVKSLKKTAAALCAALTLSAAAYAEPVATERQIDMLTKTAMIHDGWFVLPERDKNANEWRYTITDLDRNGRLEVLKVRRGWAEGGPMLMVKEVAADGKGLVGEVDLGGIPVPDILATQDPSGQPLTTLYDPNANRCHYIFQENVYHTEYELITTKYALTFFDGTLHVKPLASYEKIMSGYDGSTKERYYLLTKDGIEGADIDAARYAKIEQEAFPGCEPLLIVFRWRSAEALKAAASQGYLKESLAETFTHFAQ